MFLNTKEPSRPLLVLYFLALLFKVTVALTRGSPVCRSVTFPFITWEKAEASMNVKKTSVSENEIKVNCSFLNFLGFPGFIVSLIYLIILFAIEMQTYTVNL